MPGWSVLIPAPTLDERRPVDLQNFTREFIPPILCYYATAILILIPRTFLIRLALLPITLLAAFRAAVSLDFAIGGGDDFAYMNQGFILAMTTLALRAVVWTFKLEPYRRRRSSQKPDPVSSSTGQLFLDAFDLMFNLRGVGWDWCHGLRVPQETRDVTSTPAFLRTTLIWTLQYFVLFDFWHYSVQWFSPQTIGSPVGGSIFDASLPPITRYARSSLITLLAGLTIYNAIETLYYLCTVIGVLVFRQAPLQWPPITLRPYLATSLNQFWTERWHQGFRDVFIGVGGKPFTFLTGRIGGVLGAFLVSAVLHDMGCWGMGRGTDPKSISGFFIMNAVGVILEGMHKVATGTRVAGFVGWFWTMGWLLLWGNSLIDAWSSRGLVGSTFLPDNWRPSTYVLGSLFS